jgi:hypothetical protein
LREHLALSFAHSEPLLNLPVETESRTDQGVALRMKQANSQRLLTSYTARADPGGHRSAIEMPAVGIRDSEAV